MGGLTRQLSLERLSAKLYDLKWANFVFQKKLQKWKASLFSYNYCLSYINITNFNIARMPPMILSIPFKKNTTWHNVLQHSHINWFLNLKIAYEHNKAEYYHWRSEVNEYRRNLTWISNMLKVKFSYIMRKHESTGIVINLLRISLHWLIKLFVQTNELFVWNSKF